MSLASRPRLAADYDVPRNVGGREPGAVGFATTLCRMSAGGDELFWHWVSDTRCQFGGDNLGVAVEEQNGQRTGDAPEPPIGWQAGGR